MKRLILLLTLASIPCFVQAGDDCCQCHCEHCGCQANCQKCCHVVCEWKEIKEYVYTCRCQDICIPGRSEKGCTQYDECAPYCPILEGPKPLYTEWCPGDCARIRDVSKLIKIQVTRKVPTYKWAVEYCCDKCRCKIAAEDAANGNPTAGNLSAAKSVAGNSPASEVSLASFASATAGLPLAPSKLAHDN